jgi:predicted regulator of Ras-like GTPase activity (Roadblock/LC7/MglB family)
VRETLRELNTTPGLRGSAIVTTDGVIVAAELATGTDADSFAALVSSLIAQVTANLPKLRLGRLRRAHVAASRSAFALADLGGVYLVAEVERDVEPASLEIELESAATRLRRLLRPRNPAVAAPLPSPAAASVAQVEAPPSSPVHRG